MVTDLDLYAAFDTGDHNIEIYLEAFLINPLSLLNNQPDEEFLGTQKVCVHYDISDGPNNKVLIIALHSLVYRAFTKSHLAVSCSV